MRSTMNAERKNAGNYTTRAHKFTLLGTCIYNNYSRVTISAAEDQVVPNQKSNIDTIYTFSSASIASNPVGRWAITLKPSDSISYRMFNLSHPQSSLRYLASSFQICIQLNCTSNLRPSSSPPNFSSCWKFRQSPYPPWINMNLPMLLDTVISCVTFCFRLYEDLRTS